MEVVDASSFWILSCPAGRPAVGKCGRLFAHAGPNGPDCDGGRGAQNVRRQHISRPDSLGDGGNQGFREGGRRGFLRLFRISPQGLFWSALVGVFGLALSSATYYISIEHIGMSTSSVLDVHVSYVRHRARSHTIRRGDNQLKNRLTCFQRRGLHTCRHGRRARDRVDIPNWSWNGRLLWLDGMPAHNVQQGGKHVTPGRSLSYFMALWPVAPFCPPSRTRLRR